MKGPMTGLASWKHIKAIKEAVKIPVFANGNIQYKSDVERCMTETRVDGVMVAEGNLHNPCIFTDIRPVIWDIALEYIEYATKYPCPPSYARGHIFKMCHHGLQRHTAARDLLGSSRDLKDMKRSVELLRDACVETCWVYENSVKDSLPFHHWYCQPYVRPAPKPKESKVEKPAICKVNQNGQISKTKLKKMMKRCRKSGDLGVEGLDPAEKARKLLKIIEEKSPKKVYDICVKCGNPGSSRCAFKSCKPCCKSRSREIDVSCTMHQNSRAKKAQKNLANVNGQQPTVDALGSTT